MRLYVIEQYNEDSRDWEKNETFYVIANSCKDASDIFNRIRKQRENEN